VHLTATDLEIGLEHRFLRGLVLVGARLGELRLQLVGRRELGLGVGAPPATPEGP
jgi:hypothetical protein